MEQLIDLVAQKAGIEAKKSKIAVETVVKFLKDKLPAPLVGQIDTVLGSDKTKSISGDIVKSATNLFAKK